MDFSRVVLQYLLGSLILPCGYCLICYDNVVASEPVYIDCSFPGAACAVTKKTTTTKLFTYSYNESALLYHCAHKSRSCTSGPLNRCNDDNLGEDDIHCSTWCCEADKCNLPAKYEMNVVTVSATDALSCYQLIGDREERVKCLFDDAYCLFMEFGTTYSLGDTEKSGTQLCSTKKHCDDTEALCEQVSSQSSHTMRTCSMKCCATNYCNPLPWGERYLDKPDPEHSSEKSDQPNWPEQGTDDGRNVLTRATTKTPETRQTTTTPKTRQTTTSGSREQESNKLYPPTTNTSTFQPILIVFIVIVIVAVIAVLALIIVVVRQRQKIRRLKNPTDQEEPLRTKA